PRSAVDALVAVDVVQYLEPALPRMDEWNSSNRIITQANIVQDPPYNLNGAGVSVLVYDGGTAWAPHVDFGGRLTAHDSSGVANHSTHVAGTIGGSGAQSGGTYRGMAPGVTLHSFGYEYDGSGIFLYSNPGDIEDDYGDAINAYGVSLANNSIGTNTARNGFPCEIEGDYGVTASVIDAIARGGLGRPIGILWANGNERGSGRCGTTYHTTAPPACAKNHITVGALNSNDDSVTSFTSWGPADDGRLKPDVSAPGCQSNGDFGVTSCAAYGGYAVYCGTSMASPTVCGLSALILQDFRQQFPGAPDFRGSTLKALLAHNAQDLQAPGPDYQTGYGSVRVQNTIDFLRTGMFFEDELSQGGVVSTIAVVNPGDNELKVTLAWDDPPAAPNVLPALVNDLDIRVFSPTGVQHFPWTLGGLANPSAPAVRTAPDHVNNIEQVYVAAPEAGLWSVEIIGTSVPEGPQTFSVAISPRYVGDCNTNGINDLDDIAAGTSADCNFNSLPDECEPQLDCNSNSVQDICDIASGSSNDINGNSVPDECELDCNGNDIPDDYDIAQGSSPDCNLNAVPDECDLATSSVDCNQNWVPDECESDCNGNGIADECDLAAGTASDCDGNTVPDTCDTGVAELGRFVPADVQAGDEFGTGVAVEGAFAMINALQSNTAGDASGAVYVYHYAAGAWNPWQKLAPADLHAGDRLGWAIEMDGPRAVISAHVADAPQVDSGAAYFYELENGQWTERQKLSPPDGGSGDRFGAELALDGDWLVIGSFYHDGIAPNGGAAYVFHFNDDQWQFSKKISPAGTAEGDWAGRAVGLSGTTLAIGIPNAGVLNSGKVAIYEFDGADWVFSQNLLPPSVTGLMFGMALDLEDDTLVVGAPALNAASLEGRAFVYRRDSGSWVLDEELSNAGVSLGAEFGFSVAIGDGRILVGAVRDDTLAALGGSAFLFTNDADGWTGAKRFYASGTSSNSLFGHDVAIFGNSMLLGARQESAAGDQSGAAYFFRFNEDCDGDGRLDVCNFEAGGDCNDNFVLDSCDIQRGFGEDCNGNLRIDTCELVAGSAADCNLNAILDDCDIASGTTADCDSNAVPDACDLSGGTSLDCNANNVPDGCDIASGAEADCDGNGVPDSCDLAAGAPDCNGNLRPDACDLAAGESADCDSDNVPDECEPDCNHNGVADPCDLVGDLNGDGTFSAADLPGLTDCASAPCAAAL
ncbi:MAG TPA: S8 family serine peptidase, partial [Phycisphaerae bacterium]|nr:S8 family serine peptidase [Phycisphaerae bacterium]